MDASNMQSASVDNAINALFEEVLLELGSQLERQDVPIITTKPDHRMVSQEDVPPNEETVGTPDELEEDRSHWPFLITHVD